MPRLLYVLIFFLSTALHAQVSVQGRVFDISRRTPLESVVVFTSSGGGTLTDSLGSYTIRVQPSDTIWFSYLGKNTNRFAVTDIPNLQNFEISIHVIANELPAVTVKNRNYYLDSIQNRKDYAKAFNYRKPGLRLATNNQYTPGGVGVAFDLEELINFFRFKRNRQLASLQQRLIQQEQDKYIDKRFNRRFVSKVTGWQGSWLDSFMIFYRPTYDFLLTVNDLELGVYIQECLKHYERVRKGEFIEPPATGLRN